jgi:hypothetical protein
MYNRGINEGALAMNVLKILKTLEKEYGFQVYGMGEFTADCEASTAAEAWPHIEGQDETMVYLWKDGQACGTLWILMEEGEAEIYDYTSSNDFLMERLDNLTSES